MSQSTTPHNTPISSNAPIVPPATPILSATTVNVAQRLGVFHQLGDATSIARELFPGSLEIYSEEDMDFDNACRIVFRVEANGTADELADRHLEWCQRIVRLPKPASMYYCLSIGVRE